VCASLTVEMEEFKSDGGGNVFNIECRGVQRACICVYIYIYSDGDSVPTYWQITICSVDLPAYSVSVFS